MRCCRCAAAAGPQHAAAALVACVIAHASAHPRPPTDTQPCSPQIALQPCTWETRQPHTPAPCLTRSNLRTHTQPSDLYHTLLPIPTLPTGAHAGDQRAQSQEATDGSARPPRPVARLARPAVMCGQASSAAAAWQATLWQLHGTQPAEERLRDVTYQFDLSRSPAAAAATRCRSIPE